METDRKQDRLARFRRATAHALRARTTPAERTLWAALERVPLEGTHFRRQVPIGSYVADFACLATRLVIELDGPSHTFDDAPSRDRKRQAWLEAEGFRVLRFWNAEIRDNMDGVLDTIYAAIHGGLAHEPMPVTHRRRARAPNPPLEGEGRRRSRRGGVHQPRLIADPLEAENAPHPTPDLRSAPPPPGEGC